MLFSNTKSNDPVLSDEVFSKLRDFIYDKSGMFFTEGKKYLLQNRLAARLKANDLGSFEEYLYLLEYNGAGNSEMTRLFDAVTTNETSFFRNGPQLKAFQERILPGILENNARQSRRRLTIWSAGCSTGEEPYTLAIILLETLKQQIAQWKIDIYATDISEQAIASARKAEYSDYTLRNADPNQLKTYFTKIDKGYKLKENVRQMVNIRTLNFANDVMMKMMRDIDVIFCRNVIIYFDDQFKKQVLSHFYDSLRKSGYLFIGHSESLHNITKAFKLHQFPGAVAYQKEI
jgi:chemotaxis protein methyltransferase CheR